MATQVDIQDRITKCLRILESDPNSQIFGALAEAYRKNGELDKAFRVCHAGLKVHPSYGPAHVVMAKINLDRGLYDWAEIEAQKAIEIDGHTRAIELLLAEIYIYKGEFTAAIKLLKKLHDADPSNQQILRLLDIARKLPEEQTKLSKPAGEEATGRTEHVRSMDLTPILSNRELLELAVTIPGVNGAIYFNVEGFVVESEWRSPLDPVTSGACMAEVASSVRRELQAIRFGELDTVLIEAQEQIFYIVHAPKGMFLFVAPGDANLGTLRMRVEELRIRLTR